MNDGGWHTTGYVTWSFRDYWWWNQKPFVVHGVVKRWQPEAREFENLCERCNLLLNWCSTKDTWLILHICSELTIYKVFMAFFDNQVGCSISYREKFCCTTCQRLLKFMFCRNQWYLRLFSPQQWSHTLILLVSVFG
jgi:hypothetical protein